MKILIPGWTAPHSFETACLRIFSGLGVDARIVENKPRYPWNFGRSWWDLKPPERLVNDVLASWQLYRIVERERPDWVFMTKGENLRSEAFTMMKKRFGTKLAVWYVDNPFHANVSSYQALRHIQKADIYFIWANYLIDPIISAGAERVEFLPFAFDPEMHRPGVVLTEQELPKWKSDVCFVGTWDRTRELALEPLSNKGFDLAIYGQGWSRFLRGDSPLRSCVRADSIWQDDVVRAFKGTKVVLNLLRQHNWKGHNFRTMEAAGIGGGALLTPRTEDQSRLLFTEGPEILCFEGSAPNPERVREVLGLGEEALGKISQSAKRRVFEEHLLQHRISRILELLKETK